jgi:hypothetical protein
MNLFIIWFPKLKYYLLFKNSTLKEATNFLILGNDNKLLIIDAYEIELPKLTNTPISNYCDTSVHSTKTKVFEYKHFKYVYSPKVRAFNALKFTINSSLDIISRKFIHGLNEIEYLYMKKLFGDCDMKIEISSIYNILFEELLDPFYLFQIFSVILWFFNHYVKLAIVIIVTTVFSLAISIIETRKNLEDIQTMARYTCEINVYRNKVKLIFFNITI